MIIVNTQNIEGRKVKDTLGVVRGSSVRAKWFGADIIAGLRNIVGGEMSEYKDLLDEAREQAMDRMVADAKKIGADAILNVHFMTAALAQGAAEILVYGTAVKLDSKKK